MSSSSKKIVTLIVLLACVAVAIWFLWPTAQNNENTTRTPRAIPVVVAEAVQVDVPHLLNTVGIAEPLHSVVIRPQIEGVLTQVLFTEGQDVQLDQKIATIDDRVLQATLNSQKAELASNLARLRSAQVDLSRYRNLAEHNAISRQTLEQQSALVEQLKADVTRNEADIEDARVRLSYTQILSPVAGRVGIRKVDAGNLVRPTDAEGIVTITQINPISIIFTVAQTSLEPLRRTHLESDGATVQAIDRNTGKLLASGPISAFDNTVRAGSGTVQVRAIFDNEDEQLWPGQFVSVRVPVGHSRDAITVPTVAIRLGLDDSFVYRLLADNTVERVPVKVIYRDEDQRQAVIESDIKPGDKVVVDGFVRLVAGAKVSVSAEAPAASAPAPAVPVTNAPQPAPPDPENSAPAAQLADATAAPAAASDFSDKESKRQ